MKQLAVGLLACVVLMGLVALPGVSSEKEMKSVYDFTLKDIDGNEVKMKDYKDKVLLLVNVASRCGFTKQYTDMVELQKKYAEKGVVVMGFPANNFGAQEPGTDEEIKEFCQSTYDVEFPMFSKVSVKGDDIHPFFAMLTKTENPDFKGEIKWNFEKFLIGKDGKLLHRFRSKANPMGEEITKAIDTALKG